MTCVDERTMHEIVDGELKGEARREALKHIRECDRCADKMREIIGLGRMLDKAWSEFGAQKCPAPQVLYDYSEDKLSPDERASVKEHLQRCKLCVAVLEEGALLAEEFARQEEMLLKSNKERLGAQLYGKVQDFMARRFEQAEEILEKADVFQLQLKPVPVFRGRRPAKAREVGIPVMCKAGTLAVVVTGRNPEGTRVRLIDKDGKTIAEEVCSSEGVVAFLEVPDGDYTVKEVET